MENRNTMCGRLMSLGVPKTMASQAIDLVDKWQQCSGPEWTVMHLKDIKAYYIHQLAGKEYVPNTWLSTCGGHVKGPLGAIVRRLSFKKLSRTLTALNSYTAFISPKVTQKQEQKFFGSMQSEDETGLDSRLRILPKPRVDLIPGRPPTLLEYCTGTQRGPSADGKTTFERDAFAMFLHSAKSQAVRNVISRHEDYFRRVVPTDLLFNIEPNPGYTGVHHTLGVISGIQEPGYKLRAVANPDRTIQAALEPLKQVIGEALRDLPRDFTYNQRAGAELAQSWLQRGRVVHSVDLSDATNLFPWALQKDLLLHTFPNCTELIHIMDECCTGEWRAKQGNQDVTVRFTRGQPLGLGPSFFAFAFTHNTLLEGICEKHKIKDRPYAILGDDVIISNDRLHKVYRDTLRNLGCKISESKCISSDVLCEFAGMVITKDTIADSYKWRMISDQSLLPMLQVFGKSGLALLTKQQRKTVLSIADFPKPYGPGWSDGKSLSSFLRTPQGHLFLTMLIWEKERPMLVRDLISDLRTLCSKASYSSIPSLAEKYMPDTAWRQAVNDLSTFMDLPEIDRDHGVHPKEKVYLPGPDLSVPMVDRYLSKEGYYAPFANRSGDPRRPMIEVYKNFLSCFNSVFDRTNDRLFGVLGSLSSEAIPDGIDFDFIVDHLQPLWAHRAPDGKWKTISDPRLPSENKEISREVHENRPKPRLRR
uniref:RNA-dependent RNA polymerase n=1 Tax=de Lozier virus TaxID=2707287 RepID=A0A6H0DK98_9VIRU|nr:MAG: RNA-dependent RNA polymerase [de Lozier virus]